MTLEKICLEIVKLKYRLDDKIDREKKSRNDSFGADFFAIRPESFANEIFPFRKYGRSSESVTRSVDPFCVIGGTFNDYGNESSLETCRKINNLEAANGFGEYEQMGNLPLYVAHEGKNRVRLFQKHRVKIKADVSVGRIPLPKSLKLHKSWFGQNYYLSCSDGEFLIDDDIYILPFPKLIVPLYQSLGVEFGRNKFSFSAQKEQEKAETDWFNMTN